MSKAKNKYTIKKKAEGDARLTVVEKHNLKADITLKEVDDHIMGMEKTQKAYVGQKMIEDAKATNIIGHNPWLMDFSEEQLHAAHMYFEAMALSKTLDNKIIELRDSIALYQDEKAQLSEFLGFVPSDIGTPSVGVVEKESEEAQEADESEGTEPVTA